MTGCLRRGAAVSMDLAADDFLRQVDRLGGLGPPNPRGGTRPKAEEVTSLSTPGTTPSRPLRCTVRVPGHSRTPETRRHRTRGVSGLLLAVNGERVSGVWVGRTRSGLPGSLGSTDAQTENTGVVLSGARDGVSVPT